MLHTLMRRRPVSILAAFAALAVVWTWPLARYLPSRIPHDPGDPILNVWLLWWNAQAIPFTERWWNPPIFYPMSGALGLSEHLAGLGLFTTPLQLLHVNALAAYNVALILSFALSGFFTFLLVRRLASLSSPGTRDLAAFCAALIYGFGPYRAGQLAHLQVLTSQWMPLALLAMHTYLEGGRRVWLLVFAGAWLVQALSNGYYLLFFPVLIALWIAWFTAWRHAAARGLALAGTWAGASVLLVPMLVKYASIQRGLGLSRTGDEMIIFSATPSSFLNAPRMLALWHSSEATTTEAFLFPGVTSLLLVLCGALAFAWRAQAPDDVGPTGATAGRRSSFLFYTAAALIMWALALGPSAPGQGSPWWLHPYTLLARLPGFDGLRVPARFAMLATLCLSVAAGLAVSRIAPRRRRWRTVAACVLVAGLLADGWMRPMPLAPPPGRMLLPDLPHALVVELPANEGPIDVAAMYRQTLHGLPIANGYSGHTPPHYVIMSQALRRGDPSVITELARGRPLVITVREAFDPGGSVRRLIEGLPNITALGGSSGGAMFTLPALPASRVPPAGDPWPASVRRVTPDTIEIDLHQPRVVRTIGFPLRWRYRELPTRIAIEAADDATRWVPAWDDWTGAAAFSAALADPREVPVRLTVPDVSARYLRLHPVPGWMAEEIRVYGAK